MATGPRRDILLDSDGERVLVNGDYGFAEDQQAVKQGIECNVRLMQGEVWYDEDLGVPYLTRILVKGAQPIVVKAEIGRAIARTPDVSSVVAVSFERDPTTRAASVGYTARSTLGTVTGSITTP